MQKIFRNFFISDKQQTEYEKWMKEEIDPLIADYEKAGRGVKTVEVRWCFSDNNGICYTTEVEVVLMVETGYWDTPHQYETVVKRLDLTDTTTW